MSERRTAPSEQQRREYLLSGLARCGYCGNRLIGVRRPGAGAELVYYQCESATNQGRCAYHSRRADDLESEVRARLVNAAGNLALPAPDPHLEVERLETRRRGLNREHRPRPRGLDRGPVDAARASSPRRVPPRSRTSTSERQLEALAARPAAAPSPPGEAQRQLLEEWDALPFEEQRALLRRLLAEIVVTDDDRAPPPRDLTLARPPQRREGTRLLRPPVASNGPRAPPSDARPPPSSVRGEPGEPRRRPQSRRKQPRS